MRYCSRCVYPEVAVNLSLGADGVCQACRVAEVYDKIPPEAWEVRKQRFLDTLKPYRGRGNYDCILAVSGGKDSYWQTYIAKVVCGLNPLLVTYHGNSYLPEAQGNLDRMRDVFGVDHLVFSPSVITLRKLNKLCFEKMGDMNWHAHAGIKIIPLVAAVRFNIPVMIWGESPWIISGMFHPDDFVEYNKDLVLKHDMRGYTWRDMVGDLKPEDLTWLRFPRDKEIANVGVRGLYIGNYFKWDPNEHACKMQAEYGFEYARQPFERTYRRMSNLDDIHENGIHDYMKFIKFGYGRASDHASKDIRQGYMSREEGIKMVRKYDHVKPRRDLERWLEYVGMTEGEFDRIADTFRSPKVWRKEGGQWIKDNIWDE